MKRLFEKWPAGNILVVKMKWNKIKWNNTSLTKYTVENMNEKAIDQVSAFFVDSNKEATCLRSDNVFHKAKYDKGHKVIEYMNTFEVWDSRVAKK